MSWTSLEGFGCRSRPKRRSRAACGWLRVRVAELFEHRLPSRAQLTISRPPCDPACSHQSFGAGPVLSRNPGLAVAEIHAKHLDFGTVTWIEFFAVELRAHRAHRYQVRASTEPHHQLSHHPKVQSLPSALRSKRQVVDDEYVALGRRLRTEYLAGSGTSERFVDPCRRAIRATGGLPDALAMLFVVIRGTLY